MILNTIIMSQTLRLLALTRYFSLFFIRASAQAFNSLINAIGHPKSDIPDTIKNIVVPVSDCEIDSLQKNSK